jgi:hypothetical protein
LLLPGAPARVRGRLGRIVGNVSPSSSLRESAWKKLDLLEFQRAQRPDLSLPGS